MKKQFVTYEIALKLKELGFNEPCFCWYGLDDRLNHIGEVKLYMVGQPNDYEIYTTKTEDSDWEKDVNDVDAPLWSQVIDWFEDEHQLVLQYDDRTSGCRGSMWLSPVIIRLTSYGSESATPGNFRNKVFYDKYEAREQTVLKAIEIVKNETV